MAGVVLGVVPSEDAFSGFGHPATMVVALVLVVSAGLVRSGAVFLITRNLVGEIAAIAGLAFVAAIGWRLIPDRQDAAAEFGDISQFIAELSVPEDWKHLGKRVSELEEEADKADVAIVGLIRNGARRYGRARDAMATLIRLPSAQRGGAKRVLGPDLRQTG